MSIFLKIIKIITIIPVIVEGLKTIIKSVEKEIK